MALSLASAKRTPRLAVVEDGRLLSEAVHEICHFLGVAVERIDSHEDLALVLRYRRPMAVLAALDAQEQDGCHVMMQVARHDPTLPLLLLTGEDPALLGAADAVEDLFGLSAVTKHSTLPNIGAFVEFLFLAGRCGGCMGLMPI